MENYYKILELEVTATLDQIKSQHRFLVHAWHPDKFPAGELRDKAEEKIRHINEAYNVLSDPVTRKNYNKTLNSSPPRPTTQHRSSQPQQNQPHVQSDQYCESCGLPSETKYVEFYENVGMIFMRKFRSAKGNYCKSCIDFYFWNFTGKTMLVGWWGTISLIITPFILINNLLRYTFTAGMKKTPLQIAPSPSPFWVFSTVGGFLFIGLVFFSVFSSAFSQPTSFSDSPDNVPNTATYRPTQPTPRPTKESLTYNGAPCVPWTSIDASDVDSRLCVFGTVFAYGPYSNQWSTIQFSSSSTALRVMDYNFYYSSPLNYGDCVVVYGRIRDYGPYLIITPDKDAVDSIRVGSSDNCNNP